MEVFARQPLVVGGIVAFETGQQFLHMPSIASLAPMFCYNALHLEFWHLSEVCTVEMLMRTLTKGWIRPLIRLKVRHVEHRVHVGRRKT